MWYNKIDAHLTKQGFKRSYNESTLYILKSNSKAQLIVSLYVDDLLITRTDDDAVSKFKLQMQNEFDMTDLGPMSYFLGLEIIQYADVGILLSQKS